MYPSIAKACEVSAGPFAALLPFAMFPAALAPGMPGTPAPSQGKGRESGYRHTVWLGCYGPIKHVDVHAWQLLDPRVVSRRMIC